MRETSAPVVLSVGGGKGGVGKSTLAANVGAVLASKGHRVGFIDADLGGANLHLFLGVRRPGATLADYLSGRVADLAEVATETVVPNSWLISGASDILDIANPRFTQKQKLMRNLRRLDADFIFVDLGAGSGNNVVDFFAGFPHGMVVCDSLPTSIENAYAFLKNAILRGISRLFPRHDLLSRHLRALADPRSEGGLGSLAELLQVLTKDAPAEATAVREWLAVRRTLLVVNMVRDREDITAARRFAEIVKKYLNTNLYYTGYVTADQEIRQSVKAMEPLVLGTKSPETRACFEAIAHNVVSITRGREE